MLLIDFTDTLRRVQLCDKADHSTQYYENPKFILQSTMLTKYSILSTYSNLRWTEFRQGSPDLTVKKYSFLGTVNTEVALPFTWHESVALISVFLSNFKRFSLL